MPCSGTKKCLCCHIFFKPAPQSKGRQNYCSKPECKKASKKTSQKKWLLKPENSHYFKGSDNVRRVQQWRENNPNYCKKPKNHSNNADATDGALQDTLMMQDIDKHKKIPDLNLEALPETLMSQVFVLMELIINFDSSALQEMIALTRQKEDNLAITFLTKFHQLKGKYNERSSVTKPQEVSANSTTI